MKTTLLALAMTLAWPMAPAAARAAASDVFAPSVAGVGCGDAASSVAIRGGVVSLNWPWHGVAFDGAAVGDGGFLVARGLYGPTETLTSAMSLSPRESPAAAWRRNAQAGWPCGIVRVRELSSDWRARWDGFFDEAGPRPTVASVDFEAPANDDLARLGEWLRRYRYRLRAVVVGSGPSSPYDAARWGVRREDAVARVGRLCVAVKQALPGAPVGVTVDCGEGLIEWSRAIGWRPDFVAVLGAYRLEADLPEVARRARARFGATPLVWAGVVGRTVEGGSRAEFEAGLPAAVERARAAGFAGVLAYVP